MTPDTGTGETGDSSAGCRRPLCVSLRRMNTAISAVANAAKLRHPIRLHITSPTPFHVPQRLANMAKQTVTAPRHPLQLPKAETERPPLQARHHRGVVMPGFPGAAIRSHTRVEHRRYGWPPEGVTGVKFTFDPECGPVMSPRAPYPRPTVTHTRYRSVRCYSGNSRTAATIVPMRMDKSAQNSVRARLRRLCGESDGVAGIPIDESALYGGGP